MKKEIIYTLAMTCASLTLLVGCSGSGSDNKQVLLWGTEATYAPFESLDDQGKIIGFDADLQQAICKELKVSCQLENAPFPSLIPSLNIGKYAAIIGGLAITHAREKVINFSMSYYQDQVVLVTNGHTTLEQLDGKIVGVQGGTSFQHFLQVYYPHSKVNTYASNMNALADLASHRVNAVLIDQPVYATWLAKQSNKPKFKVYLAAKTQQQKLALGMLGNGIGVAKTNPILLHKINNALLVLQKNGKLSKLKQKWFGKAV